jgi:NAD(P)-dependent dehydrogenase (short-subunit alcohol dehydrogenase family)
MVTYDFSGKAALVTGGASGIGEACVKQFAASGAAVLIADLNEPLLHSVFYCMRREIEAMLNNPGGGAIVNIASVMGFVTTAYTPAYTAAKHAVLGMTKAAAQSYSARGIRVNAVCPGYIQTPMMMNGTTPEMREKLRKRHPIGRLGLADEQAAVALFLCSDAAAFMTGGGYPVDGGYLLN